MCLQRMYLGGKKSDLAKTNELQETNFKLNI